MTHGPCDARCLDKNKRCTKGFPKRFLDETLFTEDSYVQYRRRNTGQVHCRQEGGFGYDNRHVVPYNRYLLLKYQCHINVECCISIKSVKYIHKYIHKGHDHTTMQLAREGQPINEVEMYLDARYVSAMEAFMRLSRCSMHEESPP